jgi:hypothetical protein
VSRRSFLSKRMPVKREYAAGSSWRIGSHCQAYGVRYTKEEKCFLIACCAAASAVASAAALSAVRIANDDDDVCVPCASGNGPKCVDGGVTHSCPACSSRYGAVSICGRRISRR